ncbi:MAG: type II toxin-antitoxin system RelE/ParE family toxin [Streptosporangiaceae bacterium]
MRWTVIALPAVDDWLTALDADTFGQVTAAVRELQAKGPALPRPLADTVKGSRHKNMKELRPGSAGRSEIRILFAFDPARQAILLVAGDKAGQWQRWYKTAVPLLMTDSMSILSE